MADVVMATPKLESLTSHNEQFQAR